MSIAYIGLGSNLGESQNILQLALADIAAHTAIQKLECSRFYRSSPVDSSGPDYVNAVARLETTLASLELLHWLQELENRYGRERPYVNAPRTLDLDILLFNNEINQSAELTLPHPRIHERAFVLLPLQELSPGLILAQGTLGGLLEQCKDQGIELL
ncbi:2-amino-4-hydroxy-6-hydroxymethyldihydropteridine diphosphokinase [Advenella sp. WQ 585]|uniref:2-amino-4-hydroxy-6-hydroxymethyldihydropteridine pyrophosphokinase n=1 Tax=Advenella mandrilli TaxID=2800330 RepID=A0ABS1E950_9BURK|nr:2-amino-4-hydroxy-6-hydroxymethyldihydropteridine diphosphokinase [Advenella mandrilli]MBK1780257.1 2-amino-4-hydroxy-6-hydroxymethyldihydropteridine diphosphokinase [Advenella mandrilli]